jgi:hypothetical protein
VDARAEVTSALEAAGALIKAGALEDAEGLLRHVLATTDDGDVRVFKLLGLVRFKLSRFAEAREAYQALAKITPEDPTVRLNLGLIALKLDWVEESIAELEVAARLGPEMTSVWGYLGYAYARAGRVVVAAEAFRRAGQHALADQVEAGIRPAVAPPGATPLPVAREEREERPVEVAGAAVDANQRAEGEAPLNRTLGESDQAGPANAPVAVRVDQESAPVSVASCETEGGSSAGSIQTPPKVERRDGLAPNWGRGESGFFTPSDLVPAFPDSPPGGGSALRVEGFAPAPDAEMPAPDAMETPEADPESTGVIGMPRHLETPPESAGMPLTQFVSGRLLEGAPIADEFTSPLAALVGEVVRFSVRGEAHVRVSGLLAATGQLVMSPALKRVRGRMVQAWLDDERSSFYRCLGDGEVFLAPLGGDPTGDGTVTGVAGLGRLVALTLEDDILYVRQDRVIAFDGGVMWECGLLPGTGLALIQLRGTGRVVIAGGDERIRAFKVPAHEVVVVARGRLLGWVGRIVAQAIKPPVLPGQDPGKDPGQNPGKDPGQDPASLSPRAADLARRASLVACEGEGVLLVSTHGQLDQPVYQRAQSGDDGAGVADSVRSRSAG